MALVREKTMISRSLSDSFFLLLFMWGSRHHGGEAGDTRVQFGQFYSFYSFYNFGKIWETLTENVFRWVGWSWPDVLPWSVLAFEAYSPSSRCWWLQSSGIIGQLNHHHQINKKMIKNDVKVCCWWRFSSSSTTGRSAPTLCAAGFAGQTTEQVFYRKIQRKVLFTQYI